jgi:hypothetical protein
VQGRDRGADASVPATESLASEEVVFARSRPAGGVDPLERGHEASQVGCRPAEIGEPVGGGVLAV